MNAIREKLETIADDLLEVARTFPPNDRRSEEERRIYTKLASAWNALQEVGKIPRE